jgi:hypothetical protein
MKINALLPLAFALAAVGASAQDKKEESKPMPAMERASATAKFEVGTMTVDYGQPTWNDKMAGAVKVGASWRMGNNMPTNCTLDCGLESANGPIVPGSYKLGLKYAKEGVAHLVVYQGAWLHEDGLPTWEIASESLKTDAPVKSKLEISFTGNKMNVGFGPYAAVFALKPIKAHAPYSTEFADAETSVRVLALPLGDGPIKDLNVGQVQVTRGELTTAWNLFLTVDGENAKLSFKNVDLATMAKDKAVIGNIAKMLGEMSAKAEGAQKEQMVSFTNLFESQLAKLTAKEKALERLHGEKTLESKATKRAAAASVLEFSTERPEGALILKFGAQGSDLSFEIKPREFMQRRRQG